MWKIKKKRLLLFFDCFILKLYVIENKLHIHIYNIFFGHI